MGLSLASPGSRDRGWPFLFSAPPLPGFRWGPRSPGCYLVRVGQPDLFPPPPPPTPPQGPTGAPGAAPEPPSPTRPAPLAAHMRAVEPFATMLSSAVAAASSMRPSRALGRSTCRKRVGRPCLFAGLRR